jgi:electron transfer flavoprotein alpha subunit
MNALVLAEHNDGTLSPATLATVTAATKLGGQVHILVAGGSDGVAAEAAKVAGVARVLHAADAVLANQLPENLAPLIAGLMAAYDAFLPLPPVPARTWPRAWPRCWM